MAHSAWMPLYWGDYFKQTLEFSTFQHGCYLLLIGAYWARGGPLPNDPKALANICKTSPDKLARYGNPVLAKFTSKDGLLYHDRVEKELLRSGERQAAAIANGRAGGLAKSKLTTITPTIESKKVVSLEGFVIGGGGRKGGIEMTPENKLSLFHNWLAPLLGEGGWVILQEAMDPTAKGFDEAVALCRQTARKNGKGWPHQWPKRESANGA